MIIQNFDELFEQNDADCKLRRNGNMIEIHFEKDGKSDIIMVDIKSLSSILSSNEYDEEIDGTITIRERYNKKLKQM